MRRRAVIWMALWVAVLSVGATPLRIVSYNVENLFYPERDSLNPDSSFTPEGERKWSYTRYYNKTENIARVLTNIGEWEGVDVAGLQEVESKECLKRLCQTMRPDTYEYVHYDSPDPRGIDVALVYKKERIDTIRTRAIQVKNERTKEEGELITRDILYVCARVKEENRKMKGDTLHFFVCHLPSQRGGAAETEWKRQAAREVLQRAVDSVLATDEKAKIIVMGDMNSNWEFEIQNLRFKIQKFKFKISDCPGTQKHKGQWSCLDRFYTSPAVDSISQARIYDAEWLMEPDEKHLGLKPKRTYTGLRYQNGYSDHLPIILDVHLP